MERDGGAEVGYRLGGREKRGLLAGWRAGQVASVAAGLVIAVGFLRAAPGMLGLAGAILVTLAGIAGACWPVGGRTIDEWIPALVRHAALVVSGAQRGRDPEPPAGHAPTVGEAPRRALPGARRGGPLDPLVVETGPAFPGSGNAPAGVLRDREARTCSVVLAVRGGGFALLGPGERRERVTAWSRLLASVVRDGTVAHRLQWLERCAPDGGGLQRRHFEESGAPPDADDARRSYAELLDLSARRAVRHELYLVVTVREPRRRQRGAQALSASQQAVSEAAALARGVQQAGAQVDALLGPDELRTVLLAPLQPAAAATAAPPSPAAYRAEWDHLRIGATVHASYWVAEWPRTEVGSDFLVPLLTNGGARRTMSVTLAPVPSLRASRDAEHARTSGVADAEIRRRHGFAVTARARRDHQAVLQREEELAAGHASYRFSGYVTVTAGDLSELRSACETVERLAASCQLELRRLYGAQDAGFLATSPVGRGLS